MTTSQVDPYLCLFYSILKHCFPNIWFQIVNFFNVSLQGWQGLWFVVVTANFQKSRRKKSYAVKSGKLEGQFVTPKRFENQGLKIFIIFNLQEWFLHYAATNLSREPIQQFTGNTVSISAYNAAQLRLRWFYQHA